MIKTISRHSLFILLICIIIMNSFSQSAFADTQGIPSSTYDPCQATKQLINLSLLNNISISSATTLYDYNDRPIQIIDDGNSREEIFLFVVLKCSDNTCSEIIKTPAYVYGFSDTDGPISQAKGITLIRKNNRGSFFSLRVSSFTIKNVWLVIEEPGTYVIYAFTPSIAQLIPTKYYERIFVTINEKGDFSTCGTPANNGYYRTLWNESLPPSENQLLTFEHIPGKDEAWMENRSSYGFLFPYVHKWSYTPQPLQIASLTYKAEALNNNGRPEEAYCKPTECYIPPYTKVTIIGGTFYLDGYPNYEDFRVAYAREDTYNISNLFISFGDYYSYLENPEDEIAVYALPEDEIGAYELRDDGTKEYLIFQTYDICMNYLGSEELCQGNERCYHK